MPKNQAYDPLVTLCVDGFRLQCREQLDAHSLDGIVQTLRRPPSELDAKAELDGTVVPVKRLDGEVIEAYVRSFGGGPNAAEAPQPAFMRAMRLLFSHHVERAGRHALALEQQGMSVPKVLCYGEERHFGLLQRGLLLTEWVPGDNLLMAYRDSGDDRLLRSAVQLLAELHHRGYVHGEPSLRHFIKGQPHLYLCDFKLSQPYSPSLQERDLLCFLSHLSVETRDPMLLQELLRYYENLAPRVLHDRHAILRKVARAA